MPDDPEANRVLIGIHVKDRPQILKIVAERIELDPASFRMPR